MSPTYKFDACIASLSYIDTLPVTWLIIVLLPSTYIITISCALALHIGAGNYSHFGGVIQCHAIRSLILFFFIKWLLAVDLSVKVSYLFRNGAP